MGAVFFSMLFVPLLLLAVLIIELVERRNERIEEEYEANKKDYLKGRPWAESYFEQTSKKPWVG